MLAILINRQIRIISYIKNLKIEDKRTLPVLKNNSAKFCHHLRSDLPDSLNAFLTKFFLQLKTTKIKGACFRHSKSK